jgi:hypothetical protein
MSGRVARAKAECEHRLSVTLKHCAACNGAMPVIYTKARKLMTMNGLVQLRLQIRSCQNSACERFHKVCHPEAEGSWALPEQEFGLDVVLRVGQLRYREHRSRAEIHQCLLREGATLGERSVSNLLTHYDILLSLSLSTLPERAAKLSAQGRAILAIDGLQPDVGHEVLWVVREVLSGEVLCARSLLSSSRSELQTLLADVAKTMPVPVTAVLSDGQHTIRQAAAAALPGVPHQLCQFHYLREAARPLWEADRHAKKELKKLVRGVRPLERAAENGDESDDVVMGYCAAVRSALTEDARPPLVFAGLRLRQHLVDIHDSVQKSTKKGGR